MNELVNEKTFKRVKAKNVHVSSVIPPRSHDPRFFSSIKAVGVQQPLITRPVPSSSTELELMDGGGRLGALDPEADVYVEVREATDAEVFKINEATSVRTEKTAREKAAFYAAYVEAVKREKGENKAESIVAKEAQISQSELSQYLTIDRLFLSLNQLEPETKFEKLGKMGINKLYTVSWLLDKPELIQAAHQIEDEADNITEERIKSIVEKLSLKPEDLPMGADLPEPYDSEAVLADRLKDVSEKVVKKREELAFALQVVKTGKLKSTKSNVGILEKMQVSIRRLIYYCKQLQTESESSVM